MKQARIAQNDACFYHVYGCQIPDQIVLIPLKAYSGDKGSAPFGKSLNQGAFRNLINNFSQIFVQAVLS